MATKETAKAEKHEDGIKLILRNKKAHFDYEILERLECGIELAGSEVKSLRGGFVSFADSYVRMRGTELVVCGLNISEYAMANRLNHDPNPNRGRRLLAHRREINKLAPQMDVKGLTVVPLSLYFKGGRVKLEIGLARGKATYDKRETIKKREFDRHKQRTMNNYNRG